MPRTMRWNRYPVVKTLVVSMALLGLSLGGMAEFYGHRKRVTQERPDPPLTLWAMLGALAMSVSIFLVVRVGGTGSLFLLVALTLPAFFFGGITMAAAFRRFAARSSLLYAADLIGAALGAVAVIEVLDAFGGPNGILFAGFVAGAGALSLAWARSVSSGWKRWAAGTLAVNALLLAGNIAGSFVGEVPIGRDLNKDLFRILANPSAGAEVVEQRWSSFGRTDLARYAGDPHSMGLYIDGAAGTSMFHWSGALDDTTGGIGMLKHHFSGSMPFRFLEEDQKNTALIIGAGGGRDVLVNLLHGVEEITAVEVNPDLVQLVKEYADYNGGLYTQFDNVRIVVAEGRHFLARSAAQYDIIMLTLPITKSSRSYEGYALTENFLFTRESFRDYLDHLTPEGSLIIVAHGLPESIKLLSTALTAFEDRGVPVPEAMKQVYLLGSPMMPVFVVQKRPLDPARAEGLHLALHQAGYRGQESYVPYVEQVVKRRLYEDIDTEWRMMNQNLIDLAQGKVRLEELVQGVPIDIGPVSDDRPFFFKFEPGLPGMLTGLFWLSGLFLAGTIGIPVVNRRRKENASRPVPWTFPLLFAGIGTGFMLVEITLFQKLVLYLGQPTSTLALLLMSLLLGTGLGSLASGRIGEERVRGALWRSAVGIAAAVLLMAFLLVPLFDALLGGGPSPKTVAVILLVSLGMLMGFPFPLAIRVMNEEGLEDDIPWMWGINGAASVFGSVLAVAVAITVGYIATLVLGGLVYAGAAVAVRGVGSGLVSSEREIVSSQGSELVYEETIQ